MEVVIAIIVSSIISCLVTLTIRNRKAPFVGTLAIDRSDPGEPPYPFFEIVKGAGGLDGVARHSYITLKVENRNYITQE